MRRILSIVLALVFGLVPAMEAGPANLLAGGLRSGWTGKADASRLPACCRRNGKHHCAMDSDGDGETAVASADSCPFLPGTLPSTAPVTALLLGLGLALALARKAGRARVAAAMAAMRPTEHTWPRRGPPAFEFA